MTIILLCSAAHGQKKMILKADSLVSNFYFNSGFDTSYVSRPEKRFMAALHPVFSSIEVKIAKNERSVIFSTELSDKIGALLTYRGYGFGYSIKPRHGRAKSNDGEFNFRFFCRRFGFETDFCKATSFTATITNPDSSYIIPRGDIDFKMRLFSVYYVFNNKHFSFPAAFDKSYTQIKSCGSMLLGASFGNTKLNTDIHDFKISSHNLGIGAGYGYNFVTRKMFLVHISVIPTFVFWERNELKTTSGLQDMGYKFTDLCIYGRTAASYNFKRIFVGMDYILYATLLGDYKDVSTRFMRNSTRFFAGFWF